MKLIPCPLPGPLRHRWHWTVVIFSAVLLTGVALLRPLLTPPLLMRWSLQALAAATVALGLFRRLLPLNRSGAEDVLQNSLGAGTGLTLLRGLLLALMAGFVGLPWWSGLGHVLPWIPGGLYLVAALLDGLDGTVARRCHSETLMGARLDMAFDALGIALVALLLVEGGKAPGAYLLVGAAYYLFQAGLSWRQRHGLPLVVVRPWNGARLLAGFQMGFAGAALLPLFSPAVTHTASWVLLIPFLAGFLRDWLIAAGRIRTDAAQRSRLERALVPLVRQWIPPLLRLALFPATLLHPGPGPGTVAYLPLAFAMAGCLGRLAAAVLTVSWGLALSFAPPSIWGRVLLVLGLVLMLTGSGRFSLWHPEERWLAHRIGARAGTP